jgi:hypothetical protein
MSVDQTPDWIFIGAESQPKNTGQYYDQVGFRGTAVLFNYS